MNLLVKKNLQAGHLAMERDGAVEEVKIVFILFLILRREIDIEMIRGGKIGESGGSYSACGIISCIRCCLSHSSS